MFPILWTLLTSLKPNADIVTAEIQYLPLRPTLQNYATLWGQAGFPDDVPEQRHRHRADGTGVPGGRHHRRVQPVALSFSRRGQILLFYLVDPHVSGGAAAAADLHRAARAGPVRHPRRAGAGVYRVSAPVCIWMLKGFFDSIPPELEDAARIDGCTRAGAIMRVVLPLARRVSPRPRYWSPFRRGTSSCSR